MLTVISPAKTLDFETPPQAPTFTLPGFLDDSAELIDELRAFEPYQLSDLMGISPKLAELNSNRYHNWALPFTADNAKQAVLAFKGDVYTGLDASNLSPDDLEYAQQHLRILSGLYGVLKPLDLMQPYRLEMGTKLKNRRGKDLYAFWDDRINQALGRELAGQDNPVLVNLASNEYFKSVRANKLAARIVTPVFKEERNGQLKLISFSAKKARGLMSRYIIRNRLSDPEDLKGFDLEGYRYNGALSDTDYPLFTRHGD
ncbi:MAG: peroxide stress protein YaaA [Gammaproteobacteria bacterium]|nr:peroxide stress protein YaaA [Gammaproteobacteria bacterium]